MAFPVGEFERLLKSKPRVMKPTPHSLERARKRQLPLSVVEVDLREGRPVLVFEQESEVAGERKFDVYYLQKPGYFHRYVISLNNELRVITVMRTSKDLQKRVAGV